MSTHSILLLVGSLAIGLTGISWSVYVLLRGPWTSVRPSWLQSGVEVVTHRSFGVLHREDGPAMVYRRTDTESRQEHFYLRGKVRFDGRPGYVRYDDHGVKTHEKYYDSTGNLHRLDGPAEILFRKGRMVSGEWFYLGHLARDFDEILYRLEADYPERATYLLRNSPYRELFDEGDTREIIAAMRSGVTSVEGIRGVLSGAPSEWVLAFEQASKAAS